MRYIREGGNYSNKKRENFLLTNCLFRVIFNMKKV